MRFLINLLCNPWLWRGLTLFSLLFFAFLYGFVANELRWFPYRPIAEAVVAFDALAEVARSTNNDGLLSYKQTVDRPTATWYQQRPVQDCILVSGGAAGYLSQNHPRGCMAWVIDRGGKELHSWPSDEHLWADTKQVKQVTGISGPANATGLHLFDNGDLLATFHGNNTFPFAVGIARFNRQGQCLWKKELLTHHFFTVDDRGHIFVPALQVADSPVSLGDSEAVLISESGKIIVDFVLELDADGNELDRINLLDCLCQSGWRGQLVRSNALNVYSEDPLHLNDVRVLNSQEATEFPEVAAGDLLVSMRNINSLAILDHKTKRIKWLTSGRTIGQHAPRVYDRGILVVDNLGGPTSLGSSQLVHIDYATHRSRTLFPTASSDPPDLCRTANCGT